MVGPDFHTPCAPHVTAYTSYPLPKKTVSTPADGKLGVAQHFVKGRDIPAQWWSVFHSAQLNNLIRIGLANSPNIAAARSAIRQAEETVNAQIGTAFLPQVTGQISGQRQRSFTPLIGPASIVNVYNPTVNVTYSPDLFGGARRELESLRAQVDYSDFQLEAAFLTLTSNIVITAVNIASLRGQIQATQEIIKLQENQLKIVKRQFNLGAVSGADVLIQQTQVAQTIATLPPLQQSLEQSMNALSVLIGEFPSESCLPDFNLKKLTLPAVLPVSLPSSLVRQRPDIRASEALLQAASGQIGVATANLYPQINLSGSYGWGAVTPSGLFAYQNVVWNYMGQILQPIFTGGALRAKKRGAVAAFEQAVAQYKQTVLQAFQNVADTLGALKNDAKLLRIQKEAEDTARQSLVLSESQFNLGGTSYLVLLVAQRQYQQTKINRIQAEAARFIDTATLFRALGGGWWNREEKKV